MSMNISGSQEFIAYLTKEKIQSLYPHQLGAIDVLSAGDSLLLATPTSSGKTVVAYYGILRAWKMGLRSLYVVPLRALAEEKYEDMKFFEEHFGLRIGISTGDYDRPSDYLKKYDVLISTSEKVDSILRNNPSVLDRMGFFVFDEIHNIGDESRGSTLEIVISKIRHLIHGAQFAAMSATVSNVDLVARWLHAKAIESTFRPVDLRRYVLTPRLVMDEKGARVAYVSSLEDLVVRSLDDSGQTVVFVKSRKAAETSALQLASSVEGTLSPQEKAELENVRLDESPGSDKLLSCLKKGVGYHHAGLTSDQRKLVERLFRERKIKLISATTTLAAGLNLPARSVIVKDIYRYNGFSSELIPNMEMQQMLGRAGRAKFDSVGNGYIYAPEAHVGDVFKAYIHGPLESIESTIDEGKLRMHVLGLISSGIATDMPSLERFFSTTLAYVEGSLSSEWIESSIIFLQDADMIVGGQTFRATPFGKKVSELYIDPVSGIILRNTLDVSDTDKILMGISATPDMQGLYVSSSDAMDITTPEDLPFEIIPDKLKVSRILKDWIDEKPESEIVDKYRIWPADIRSRVELAEWLSHSLYEISRVVQHVQRADLKTLHMRIKDGIQEDLIPLVSIPNVGRVRARRLAMNGFDSIESIASSTPEDIRRMARIQGFGDKVAEGIVANAMRMAGIAQPPAKPRRWLDVSGA